jgi:hypothetical protein
VHSYVLDIQPPNNPYNHKSVITLHGAFGWAILYFVPQDAQLGENQNRAGQEIFDVYYWMDSWPHFTDLLRNEKLAHFQQCPTCGGSGFVPDDDDGQEDVIHTKRQPN